MRIPRALVPVVAALCALTAGATTASAAPEPGPAPEVGLALPAEEARLQQQLEQSQPVVATYEGRQINLAEGWQGAQACTEVPSGKVYCFDTAEEADRALAVVAPAAAAEAKRNAAPAGARGALGTMAPSDCAYGYLCLWEHSDYTGRRLQWSASGTKQLSDWDFRDKASAGCAYRVSGGGLVYDARTALPDPFMALANGNCYKFSTASYPTGGNWNDKADYVVL
ncbi:peptidase inhibitor family I36 protein [Streptomyces sp. NPDC047315]|uniref:peptidase inhibitor family I36 protein n=1 Tax=Streptomyces sp. NPDC047315 TaxID=3155142 RepID=UPI003401E546